MKKSPFLPLFPLLTLLLILAACGSASSVSVGNDDEPSNTPAAASATLDGEYWSTFVTEDGEDKALVDGTRIQLDFADGSLGATAGCNSIGGDYTLSDDDVLQVVEMYMTEMGCPEELAGQDTFLVEFLSSAPVASIDGDTLTLSSASVTIELLERGLADPDLPIIGTEWEVTGFFDASVAMSMAVEQPGWIRFIDDSTMEGFNGCGDFAMNVEVNDGSTGGALPDGVDGEFQFGSDIEPAGEDCASADFASRMSAALRGQASYVIEGPNLTITSSDGTGITLRAVE